MFGWFCVRLSGVYLAMLSLAAAQIVWSIAFQWVGVTGGDNGLLPAWEIFENYPAELVFFGHTHVPSLFAHQGRDIRVALLRGESGSITIEPGCRYLINPGSIGQPRDRDPRAAYMTYDSEKRIVRWHRVAYPVDRAQQRILKAGLPKLLADRLAIGT